MRSDVIWKQLRVIISTTQKLMVHGLIINNWEIFGDALANTFSNFVNIGTLEPHEDVNNSISDSSQAHSRLNGLLPDNMPRNVLAIVNLKINRARDMDNQQVKPIKHVIDLAAPILERVHNLCFGSGIFPVNMPVAKVAVLFKNGDKN